MYFKLTAFLLSLLLALKRLLSIAVSLALIKSNFQLSLPLINCEKRFLFSGETRVEISSKI